MYIEPCMLVRERRKQKAGSVGGRLEGFIHTTPRGPPSEDLSSSIPSFPLEDWADSRTLDTLDTLDTLSEPWKARRRGAPCPSSPTPCPKQSGDEYEIRPS